MAADPSEIVADERHPSFEHLGTYQWKNGAEMEWVCVDRCPHPNHDHEAFDVLWERLKQEKGWTFGPLPAPTLRSRLRRWFGRKVRHCGSSAPGDAE